MRVAILSYTVFLHSLYNLNRKPRHLLRSRVAITCQNGKPYRSNATALFDETAPRVIVAVGEASRAGREGVKLEQLRKRGPLVGGTRDHEQTVGRQPEVGANGSTMHVALDDYMRQRRQTTMMQEAAASAYAAVRPTSGSSDDESGSDEEPSAFLPEYASLIHHHRRLSPPLKPGFFIESEGKLSDITGESMATVARATPSSTSTDEYDRMLLERGVPDVHPLIFENAGIDKSEETGFGIASQVFFPFLIAGVGMVCAGLLLDVVQHWPVFKNLSEIFVMVPALLGLKGNLEMTLAARLSTQANLGNMDSRGDVWHLAVSNLALIQCQALVVAFLSSVAAIILGWMRTGTYNLHHALILCSSALVTAALASVILGIIMIFVIIVSRKWGINPDNVATPIAASLGDLTTLALLSFAARFLYAESCRWLAPALIGGFLITTPVWICIARRNTQTKGVLRTGWVPVICAMLISSLGGMILGVTVGAYKGIAVFQPVINGAGGNLSAVQASRLSTYLHKRCPFGQLPSCVRGRVFDSPARVFLDKGAESVTARVLLGFVIPGHVIFVVVIALCNAGHMAISPVFMAFYLTAALIQVALLLYAGHVLVHWMWKKSIDPDNSAIPFLTALGDLLGTGFLAVVFHLLFLLGIGEQGLTVKVT